MQQENTKNTYESPLRIVKAESDKAPETKPVKIKALVEPKLNMPKERHRYIKPKLHDPL